MKNWNILNVVKAEMMVTIILKLGADFALSAIEISFGMKSIISLVATI
jgi:hypothetical protein